MFEEIRIMFSDFGKTYSRLVSAMRRSSESAPSFIYSWTKYIAGKLLSITLLAVAALVVIAATQFFVFLAINLFLTGQIIPALLTLVPIAFCVAASVPIFNQLLRITGIAERCRKLVQKGKDMEFFGRAKIPSRKTPAEKNALSAEVDNPQLQIRITPPLPTRWVDISYLVAPSDFYAFPEYIRYAANWLVKKSGLMKYAASLDSISARSEFRSDTEYFTNANPALRAESDIDISKVNALRFVQMSGAGYTKDINEIPVRVKGINAEIGDYVKNRFKPNDPEFKTYHQFLIAKPVNHLYLKWYREHVLPLEQKFTAANNAFIEFRQEQMRFEEQRKLPLSKLVAQEVAAASKMSGMAAFKQIFAIPTKYINTKYAQLTPEAQAHMQKLIEAKVEAEQNYTAVFATENDNGKQEYRAKKEFIAEFEAEYTAFKASQIPADASNEAVTAHTMRQIPNILLLNDKIGIHLENNVKVLSAEEASDKKAIEMKIAEFDAPIEELNSQIATLRKELELKEQKVNELKNSVAAHPNAAYRKYAPANADIILTQEMRSEIASDELLSQFYAERDKLVGISRAIELLDFELEVSQVLQRKEHKKLEKYSSEYVNLMHDLQAVVKGIETQINAGLNSLSQEYPYIFRNEEAAKKILGEARASLNIDDMENALPDIIKNFSAAVLNKQQASTAEAKAEADEQLNTAQNELVSAKVALQMSYAALPAKLYEVVLERYAKFKPSAGDPEQAVRPLILNAWESQVKQRFENKSKIEQQTKAALALIDDLKAKLGYIPPIVASRLAPIVTEVPGSDPYVTEESPVRPKSPLRRTLATGGSQ